jgi:hypothetical protein
MNVCTYVCTCIFIYRYVYGCIAMVSEDSVDILLSFAGGIDLRVTLIELEESLKRALIEPY